MKRERMAKRVLNHQRKFSCDQNEEEEERRRKQGVSESNYFEV